MADRAVFAPLAPVVGAVLAMEIAKVMLGLGRPGLPATVWELDGLTMRSTLHHVLQRPDCPACRKKGRPPPPQPGLSGLCGGAEPEGDLSAAVDRLVSPHCGIVRSLGPVPKDPSEPEFPMVIRAELANHGFTTDDDRFTVCSGKGMSPAEARVSALGEAVERYGGRSWDADRVLRCRRASLPGPSLDPCRLVLYADEQYESLPYSPWSEDTETDWVGATLLGDGSTVFVPALAVFMDYQLRSRHEFLFPVTSNGLAAGPSLPAAVLRGLLEVVERDGFLLSWMHRLPGRRLDVGASTDPAVASMAAAYRRRGVELNVVLVPTDHPATVAVAIGVDLDPGPDRPAAVVGLGADLDPAVAVRRAALEVGQVRPALRARMRDPANRRRLAELLADPGAVRDLEDHDLLFADRSKLEELDFWLGSPVVSPPVPHPPASDRVAADLSVLAGALAEAGSDVYYVNLTPPDLAALGVSVARALVADFQPIHFGAREARLGGERLGRFPALIGRPDYDQIGTGVLNLHPHPLA